MKPTPRIFRSSRWLLILLVALVAATTRSALAQDAEAPAEPPADVEPAAPEAPVEPDAPEAQFDLRSAVENFWHYGKIARYDVAVASGQQILASGEDPADILVAFEQVSTQRRDNLDQWLLRWQNVPEMQEVTTQITNTLEVGRRGRAEDPQFIRQHIERLSAGERPYAVALGRLRAGGEVSVAFMLEYLRNPTQTEHHAAIRRALRDMGRFALNPLVAATEMRDWDTLVTVCTVLGDLGYDAAAPYLARLLEQPDVPSQVKAAATEALNRLGMRGQQVAAADLFFDLGEKLYYDRASIVADNRLRVAYIWYWGPNGLVKLDVPPPIFNELMSMRACEYALKLDSGQNDALSLWLAANYKREVELPPGESDPTRLPEQPDAHYYGVVTGSQYLNTALDRALRDRNAPVAMKIIASLQEIIGQSNMFTGALNRPLIGAMQYPDRLVRYEAAFALAGALPQSSFQGQEMVVPLLGEALAQTGQPTVFLVIPSENELNVLLNDLRGADGYFVGGATNPDAAVASAAQLPAIDAFVISWELGDAEVDRLLGMINQNTRLRSAARVIITPGAASRYETMRVADPMMFTTTATTAAGLQSAIDQARQAGGSLPMDADVASDYATRAGELLRWIAISRGQVYDLFGARTPLLASLDDPRPQIVMLGGSVLGLLNDREAQSALLQAAQDDEMSEEVRVSLFNSLATSAKFFGNMLDGAQIESLQGTVSNEPNLDVRSAAAEAHGALNLPPDQSKALIIDQSRTVVQ